MRRSLGPLIPLLMAALILLGGCHTWAKYKVPSGATPSTVATGHPERLTMRDGTELQIWDVRMHGDSLIGNGTADMGRIAVPVANVRSVKEFRTNKVLTTLLGVTGGLLVLVAYSLATWDN